MSLPIPEFLADPQELGLLPGKIAHLLLARAVELVVADYKCAIHNFLPKH